MCLIDKRCKVFHTAFRIGILHEDSGHITIAEVDFPPVPSLDLNTQGTKTGNKMGSWALLSW